jgi:hypothetical protein
MNNSIKAALLSILMLIAFPSNGQTCKDSITRSTPDKQFTINDDGTVTDNKTTLTWMRCSLGQVWEAGCTPQTATKLNWEDALTAANITSDWRLPNIKELNSIAEQACDSPAINASIFPNTQSAYYWSSSPVASDDGRAWVVNFSKGGDVSSFNKSNDRFVRLVRGGQ